MFHTGYERSATIQFGFFELDTRAGELRKRGVKLKLSDQAYYVLRALLNSPGEIVTREQLRKEIWPDRPFMDFDNAINKSVSQLRTALSDIGSNPRFIETLSKRGYRFIAPLRAGPPGDVGALRSIAVLPFENLTGNPALAYVADGITETLTTGLSGLRQLRVISRTSAKACMIAGRSVGAIGRDLHVNVVVEGSVIRFAQLVRISVRIVETHSDRVLWQAQYDSELENLLTLCDQLIRAVAGEISEAPVQRQATAAPLPSTQAAYLMYLKGRYFWSRRTEKDLYRAIDEFQKAIAIDEGLALAHTGLADCYALLGIWGFEPCHSAFRVARRAATRAVELDDGLAEAHASLAEVLKDYDWDWPAAESEFRRAIALNPNYSFAHHSYAQLLVSLRRYPEAAEQIELARRVDPLSPAINAYLPYIYVASRDYQRAAAEADRAVELEPNSPLARLQLGRACLFLGEVGRAVTELETASELAHGRPMWRAELSFARARAGDQTSAETILNELIMLAKSSYVSPYDLALCYAGLGYGGAALDHLEQAYTERVMRIVAIGDPELDGLRSDPRFGTLLERLCLPRTEA
jgi:TolB-like protein/DNA-binding winged helix-turn-helix (wHTH) protein/Tfp pilus assembly protein PilF